VAVRGTYDIMPKHAMLIRPRQVAVDIGAPIATQGIALDSKAALMDGVRNAILLGLAAPEERRRC
jgi:hypothetical protein